MMQISYPPFLKSASIVNILVPALWVRLGFGALSLLFSLIQVVIPPLYGLLQPLDGLQSVLAILISISTLIMGLIWVYKVHQDLPQFYGEYPISPSQSLAQFMIPFYNIWGIWNTLNTLAQRFIGEPITEQFGRAIKAFLPWFYGVAILSNVLNRTILRQEIANPGSVSPFMFLITTIVDLGLDFILLQLGLSMAKGMAGKANNKAS
jgi:hypothetical protein